MDKKEILDILDNAKDEKGAVPMRLARRAFDKLVQPEERTELHACDCISRQAAIEAVKDAIIEAEWEYAENAIKRLPPVPEHTETLLDDGTLQLECDSDLSKVTRVNVRQRGTHLGDLFYRDED